MDIFEIFSIIVLDITIFVTGLMWGYILSHRRPFKFLEKLHCIMQGEASDKEKEQEILKATLEFIEICKGIKRNK